MLTRALLKQGHKSIGELRYNLYTDTYGMVVIVLWNVMVECGMWAGTYDTLKEEEVKNKVGTKIHHITTNDVCILPSVRCSLLRYAAKPYFIRPVGCLPTLEFVANEMIHTTTGIGNESRTKCWKHTTAQ